MMTGRFSQVCFAHIQKGKKKKKERKRDGKEDARQCGGRISTIGVYQRIRKLRDISLHGNRGIIDREVCSTRQIDGRGEKDEIEWKLERLKDNGDRGRGTTTARRKSEIFLPFSPGTPDLFPFLLRLAMRTIIWNCVCLCCVLVNVAWWIRMLEFNSRWFHPLGIECYKDMISICVKEM